MRGGIKFWGGSATAGAVSYNNKTWEWQRGYGTQLTDPVASFRNRIHSNTGRWVAGSLTTSPWLAVYPFAMGFGTAFTAPTPLPTTAANTPAWGINDAEVFFPANLTSYVYPFSSAGYGTMYTGITFPQAPTKFTLSPNGTNLAISTGSTGTSFYVYKWTSGVGFGTSYTVPASNANLVEWSPDGNVLFQGLNSTPFIRAYAWTEGVGVGTTYAAPAVLPPSRATGMSLSRTGNYVAISYSDTSPWLNIYPFSFTGGWGTKIAAPQQPATTANWGVGWSEDNDYFVTSDSGKSIGYNWSETTGLGTRIPDATGTASVLITGVMNFLP